MEQVRVVFMGTPDFSVPTLEALIEGPHQVVGVFTQPDKEKGRGHRVQMSPVKEKALANQLPVYQPDTFKSEDMKALMDELHPDIIIVIAYGKILPSWLIHYPRLGCINLHASLLPKYRGAAPIHYALLNGDAQTGITIMHMDEGMDTGAIISEHTIPIHPEDTTGSLFGQLAQLGGQLINSEITKLAQGSVKEQAQEEAAATYTKKITKEMGRLDWRQSAKDLDCRIRALSPAPGCFSFLNGKRIKVWKARPVSDEVSQLEPGTILKLDANSFTVATGQGVLVVMEVQPDNKKRMNAGAYVRGHQLQVGMQLTNE